MLCYVLDYAPVIGVCRLQNGEIQFDEHRHNEDMGGIDPLLDLDAAFADVEEYDEVPICAFSELLRKPQSCWELC